jgi:putative PEP-CTERM system TPR-repeat lipoprotein
MRNACCAAGLAALAAFGLAGCARNDAASYLASARGYAAKSDYRAALIEVKNALQKAPENGDARLLLATSLLETGDPAGAEAEVRKAIALHVPDDLTYPVLARALVAQGEFKKLVTELADTRLDQPAPRADLGVSLALASLAEGDSAKAGRLVEAALADEPGNIRARLIEAQVQAQRGDIAAARTSIDKALAKSPNDIDALMMKSQVAFVEGRRDDAAKALDQAIAANPGALVARSARLSLAVTNGELDVAKDQLAKMKERAPKDIRTAYADALVAFATRDYRHAHEAILRVLAVRPESQQSVLLSALIDYQLGAYATAEQALRKVVANAPNDIGARRALAAVYLRTGRGQLALDTLGPALKSAPDDPALLRTAGEAYLAAGDAALATSAYERANALDNGNVASKVRLAEVRFAGGDTTRAFNDLEALAAKDASGYQAEMALYVGHLRRREYDQALAAADAIAAKQPNSALPYELRGAVYAAKRDFANARANFEKALGVQPDFYSAAFNLGILDIEEGRPEAARERYERMSKQFPDNEQLLLAQAQVLLVTGDSPDRVKSALDRAVTANPHSVRARLARIEFDMRRKDMASALATAQSALAAIPDDPQLVAMLGRIQAIRAAYSDAAATFARLATLQPKNPLPLLQMAEMQLATKDFAAAIASERKALAVKPDYEAAYALLAKTYLASGRGEEAIAEARALQKAQSTRAIGYVLEGEILGAQKKWAEAANVYRSGFEKLPLAQIAGRYYVALQAAGKSSEATAMAKKWTTDHPGDATIPALLAQQSMQRGAIDDAIAGYRRVLAIEPENVVALNNLGWMLTDRKAAEGLDFAERAHRIAPFNPSILDTYGWALASNGDPKRGAQVLRMAMTLSPEQPEFRLHLAKALAWSGDKAGARNEIAQLTKLDKASPVRAEAEKFMSSL